VYGFCRRYLVVGAGPISGSESGLAKVFDIGLNDACLFVACYGRVLTAGVGPPVDVFDSIALHGVVPVSCRDAGSVAPVFYVASSYAAYQDFWHAPIVPYGAVAIARPYRVDRHCPVYPCRHYFSNFWPSEAVICGVLGSAQHFAGRYWDANKYCGA